MGTWRGNFPPKVFHFYFRTKKKGEEEREEEEEEDMLHYLVNAGIIFIP